MMTSVLRQFTALLPFGSTYLREKVCCSMRSIKTISRNCLYLEHDLVVSVSTPSPGPDDKRKHTFRSKHGSNSE